MAGEALAFFDPSGSPAVARRADRCCAPVRRCRGAAAGPDLPAPMATAGVTPREAEVLAFLAEGRSTKRSRPPLSLSETVERHIANLAAKLGVGGRSELVAYAPVTMGRDDLKMGVCPMPGTGTTPIMAIPIR